MVKRDFRGRTVVVTGGAGGIGRALGRRFASEGAHVVLVDLDLAAAEAAAEMASHIDVDGMTATVFRELVVTTFGQIAGQVVVELSTVLEGHELGPVADPQNGDSFFEGGDQQGLVEFELARRDRIKTHVFRIGVGGFRQEVIAAGQEQSV